LIVDSETKDSSNKLIVLVRPIASGVEPEMSRVTEVEEAFITLARV
jgi:hypothetical protein